MTTDNPIFLALVAKVDGIGASQELDATCSRCIEDVGKLTRAQVKEIIEGIAVRVEAIPLSVPTTEWASHDDYSMRKSAAKTVRSTEL